MFKNKKGGFTLVEILLVIAIIAILAGIVLVAINPQRQIKQANDAQRQSDINQILKAVNSYASDNRGALPDATDFPTVATNIASGAVFDICALLVSDYIAELPFDPTAPGAGFTDCTTYNLGYFIMKDNTSGRVTVSAPSTEIGSELSVTQ